MRPLFSQWSFIWDAWLGLECSSGGGFNTHFKIQAQRYLAAIKDVIILFNHWSRCNNSSLGQLIV